jgi:hypothetical protein
MGTLPAPLQLIPDDAVDLSFPAPQYSADFASIVDNAATETDGFDSAFAEAVTILTEFPKMRAGLDIAIALFDASLPGIDTPMEQEFSDAITGAITQGDPDFATFAVHLTGNSPPPATGSPSGGGGGAPAPTQKPVTYTAYVAIDYSGGNEYLPPDIGTLTVDVDPDAKGHVAVGGGGGASGTGGTIYNNRSGDSFLLHLPKATVGGTKVSYTFVYANTYNYDIKITGAILGPSDQQLWTADFSKLIGAKMHPGDTRSITVTFTPPKAAA